MLDAAYPPALAQSWDSVGLVCGDPAEAVESVTVAVDATAAVVDDVPDRGLLLAHHPLLLRGVDSVAASTPKGALVHRLIRTGRALFTAHTNADSAAPGVSDALADALGLTVVDVLDPVGRCRPGQVGDLRAARERRGGADRRLRRGRRADRRLLLLQLECFRHRAVPPARRRHPGDRPGRHRGAAGRGPGRGDRAGAAARSGAGGDAGRPPVRGAGVRCHRAGCAARRGRAGPDRRTSATGAAARFRRAGRCPAARHLVGCARGGRPGSAGVAGRGVRRRGGFAARHGRTRRCAGLPDRGPTPPSRRRAPPGLRRRPGRCRALGQRVSRGAARPPRCCARTSPTPCGCASRRSAPIPGILERT